MISPAGAVAAYAVAALLIIALYVVLLHLPDNARTARVGPPVPLDVSVLGREFTGGT